MSCLIILFQACKKDPIIWEIKNLSGNKINVVGHGGMGIKYKYPMNSMKSLNEVLLLGAFGTEMDMRLTKDSVLVLCHASDLKDATDYTGEIESKTWQEIENVKYNQPLFNRSRLISAESFFNQVKNPSLYLFVFDCKLGSSESEELNQRFARALSKLVVTYSLVNNSFIESFNYKFLNAISNHLPKVKLFVYCDRLIDALDLKNKVNMYGITINQDYITKEEIERAHSLNLRVALFNADTHQENLNAIAKSPDYIQTDNAEFLLNALKN